MKSPFSLCLFINWCCFLLVLVSLNISSVFFKKNQSVFLALSFINEVLTELVLLVHRFSQAYKRSSHFSPHVSRAQRLAPVRTRTQVVPLGAQCKTVALECPRYSCPHGHKSKFFRLNGLLLFCIIMGLRSASSAIIILSEIMIRN